MTDARRHVIARVLRVVEARAVATLLEPQSGVLRQASSSPAQRPSVAIVGRRRRSAARSSVATSETAEPADEPHPAESAQALTRIVTTPAGACSSRPRTGSAPSALRTSIATATLNELSCASFFPWPRSLQWAWTQKMERVGGQQELDMGVVANTGTVCVAPPTTSAPPPGRRRSSKDPEVQFRTLKRQEALLVWIRESELMCSPKPVRRRRAFSSRSPRQTVSGTNEDPTSGNRGCDPSNLRM